LYHTESDIPYTSQIGVECITKSTYHVHYTTQTVIYHTRDRN